jgi:hypothetical protein
VPCAPLDDLIGHALPGGRFALESYEDRLLREVVLSGPGPPGQLHPLSVFSALQRSIGMSLADFFRLCRSDASEGPVLGETRLELRTPIRVDRAYDVHAWISDVRRRTGKRAGLIDIVWLSASAVEAGREGSDSPAATLMNSYIFRRPVAS